MNYHVGWLLFGIVAVICILLSYGVGQKDPDQNTSPNLESITSGHSNVILGPSCDAHASSEGMEKLPGYTGATVYIDPEGQEYQLGVRLCKFCEKSWLIRIPLQIHIGHDSIAPEVQAEIED